MTTSLPGQLSTSAGFVAAPDTDLGYEVRGGGEGAVPPGRTVDLDARLAR